MAHWRRRKGGGGRPGGSASEASPGPVPLSSRIMLVPFKGRKDGSAANRIDPDASAASALASVASSVRTTVVVGEVSNPTAEVGPSGGEVVTSVCIRTEEGTPHLHRGVCSFKSLVPKMVRVPPAISYSTSPPQSSGSGGFWLEEPVVLKTTRSVKNRLASLLAAVLTAAGIACNHPQFGVRSDCSSAACAVATPGRSRARRS